MYTPKQILKFIENNVGQIVNIFEGGANPYCVNYHQVPSKNFFQKELNKLTGEYVLNCRFFALKEILFFGLDHSKIHLRTDFKS